MGIYNCKSKEMLFESVSSVQSQSFEDWEMIICDDGSTNDSLKWAQEINDSRVRIIHHDSNKGLAFSLNECIRESKGEFIARQDDDDTSYPLRFEKQLLFLEQHSEIDIIGSVATTFDESGELGIYKVPEKPLPNDFLWKSPFIHPAVMMRKTSLLEVSGYRVCKDTLRGQDYDLFMRMYGMGMRGYNFQEPLYHYRLINGGYKKKTLRVRVGEMRIRYNGFKQMGILRGNLRYVIKPVVLGFLPLKVLNKLRNNSKTRC